MSSSNTRATSFRLAQTPENRAKLVQLARNMRALFALPENRELAHYCGLITNLMYALDEKANHPYGTAENYRANAAAVRAYDVARVYATKYRFDNPNDIIKLLSAPGP
jgi:hypothetical protein